MDRMTRRTPSSGWRRWWLLGLLLASVLLAHDLAMAAPTRAAAAIHAPVPETFAQAYPHSHGTDVGGVDTDGAPPDHPDGCGVARPAASPNGALELAGPTTDGFPIPALAPRRAFPREGAQGEPTSLPGTRRALFQVYRI
jgi:hypothetical protein